MIRSTLLSGAVAAGAALAWSPVALVAQDHPPLMGAWVVEAVSQNGTPVATPQPGLFIFTSTHYSMMYVPGGEARARYTSEQPTDADRLAAYATIIANAGRYEVTGDQIATRAFVAKDPNYMAGWPEGVVTMSFRFVGDRLHLLMGGNREFTLRRVEGMSMNR